MTASPDEPRSLVDTNIVVYAYDPGDPAKHAIAVALLERLADEGRLVFSSQVFNEFCSVMMKPSRSGRLDPDRLSILLRRLESLGEVVSVTPSMTFRALEGMRRHGLSFWDGLIWAAAVENDIPVIFTEDYQAGREVEGVRFVNPFQVA